MTRWGKRPWLWIQMSNPTRVWGQRNKTYLQLKGNKVKDQNFLRPWSCVNMLKVHELEGLNRWSLIEILVWNWNWVSDSQCWLVEPVAANCHPKRHQRFAKLLVMLPFPFYESLSLCLFLSFPFAFSHSLIGNFLSFLFDFLNMRDFYPTKPISVLFLGCNTLINLML